MVHSGQRHVQKPEVLSIYFAYCIWGQIFIHPKLVGICSILWYLRFILLQHYRTSNGISSSLNLTRGKVDDLKVKKKGQTWSLVFHLTMSKNVVWLEIQYYINDFTEYTFPSPNMPKPTQLLWVNYKTRYF